MVEKFAQNDHIKAKVAILCSNGVTWGSHPDSTTPYDIINWEELLTRFSRHFLKFVSGIYVVKQLICKEWQNNKSKAIFRYTVTSTGPLLDLPTPTTQDLWPLSMMIQCPSLGSHHPTPRPMTRSLLLQTGSHLASIIILRWVKAAF